MRLVLPASNASNPGQSAGPFSLPLRLRAASGWSRSMGCWGTGSRGAPVPCLHPRWLPHIRMWHKPLRYVCGNLAGLRPTGPVVDMSLFILQFSAFLMCVCVQVSAQTKAWLVLPCLFCFCVFGSGFSLGFVLLRKSPCVALTGSLCKPADLGLEQSSPSAF